jgi:hypothetical protein
MSFKMKKDLWGLYHSAESATRQGNSSATPITKKASPLQMNTTLVGGAAALGNSKAFNDVSPQFSKFYGEEKEPEAENLDENSGGEQDKESEENSEV